MCIRSEGYSTWSVIPSVVLSICPSVDYHVFCHYARQGSPPKYQWFQCYTSRILKNEFHKSTAFKSYGVKQEQKSQYADEYCLTSTSLCRIGHWKHQKLLKGQVVSQWLHWNAFYEHSYTVGARNNWLWARGCGLHACVYMAAAWQTCQVTRRSWVGPTLVPSNSPDPRTFQMNPHLRKLWTFTLKWCVLLVQIRFIRRM